MRFIAPFLLCLSALTWACLEMPITYASRDENRIVSPDASDDGPQAACMVCMHAPDEPGPGCQTTFAACQADAKCKVVIQCAFDRQCFQGSRRAFLGCGLPCAQVGGILSGDDSALALASNLFQCLANGPCGDTCFSSE